MNFQSPVYSVPESPYYTKLLDFSANDDIPSWYTSMAHADSDRSRFYARVEIPHLSYACRNPNPNPLPAEDNKIDAGGIFHELLHLANRKTNDDKQLSTAIRDAG